MKSKITFPVLLVSYALFSSGCHMIGIIHSEVKASLDDHHASFQGNSPITTSAFAGDNAGYLLSEPFFTSPGGTSGFNNNSQDFDVAEQSGLADAHGPNYNNGEPVYPVSVVDKQNKGKNPAGNFVSLSEELQIAQKGYKATEGDTKVKTSLYYAEIPVLINYHYALKNGNNIYAGAGPYVATALFGNSKVTNQGQTQTNKITFGTGNNAEFKRMDYGFSLKAGYDFLKKWDLFLTYDDGLRNINTGIEDKLMNRNISINIGYMF
jgi:Outer membrane protein beta-barrel domain